MTPTLTMMVVDDHRLVRDGVRSLIESSIPEVDIIAECSTGLEATRAARQLQPDSVLMDISMPEMNGVQATRQLRRESPDCKVIALSMHRSAEYVTAMFDAGAKGYLNKDAAFTELANAIRTVAGGGTYIGKGIDHEIVATCRDHSKVRNVPPAEPQLSPREQQVLQLVAEGNRTRDIAGKLFLSEKTIEANRSRLLRKLGFSGIAELTRYALRKGIISLDD